MVLHVSSETCVVGGVVGGVERGGYAVCLEELKVVVG